MTAPRPGREFATNPGRKSPRPRTAAGFWTWDGLISYQIWTLAWIWLQVLRCHFLPRKRTGQHLLPTFVLLFSFPSSPPLHCTRRQSPSSVPRLRHKFRAENHQSFTSTISITRALAQDDNSEPRRSLHQVLTAQRFPLLFCLLFVLLLSACKSCCAQYHVHMSSLMLSLRFAAV